jgi:hypothetical protein
MWLKILLIDVGVFCAIPFYVQAARILTATPVAGFDQHKAAGRQLVLALVWTTIFAIGVSL